MGFPELLDSCEGLDNVLDENLCGNGLLGMVLDCLGTILDKEMKNVGDVGGDQEKK